MRLTLTFPTRTLTVVIDLLLTVNMVITTIFSWGNIMWYPVQKPITTLKLTQTNIIGVQGVKVLSRML